jgi:sensor histidine kinase regulating citrate/malate metabolism
MWTRHVEIHCHGVHSGGKIVNLEKVWGYLQEIFLQGVSQNTPTLQEGISLFTLKKNTCTLFYKVYFKTEKYLYKYFKIFY